VARLVWGISYSLYLIHLPITNRVMNGGLKVVDASGLGVFGVLAAALALSMISAWVFFLLVEQRFEQIRLRFMQRPLRTGE